MSCRADWQEVVAINGSTLLEPAINAFIGAASVVIDAVEASCGVTLAQDALKQSEVWLTAHLMAVSKVGQADGVGVKKNEKFEQYSVEWATSVGTGTGVMSTNYGQTANTLTQGCLAEMDKRQFSMFSVGGA